MPGLRRLRCEPVANIQITLLSHHKNHTKQHIENQIASRSMVYIVQDLHKKQIITDKNRYFCCYIPHGVYGLKLVFCAFYIEVNLLHSAWSVWIEVSKSCMFRMSRSCYIPHGVYGLKYVASRYDTVGCKLHSTWSAWIEVSWKKDLACLLCYTPHGCMD